MNVHILQHDGFTLTDLTVLYFNYFTQWRQFEVKIENLSRNFGPEIDIILTEKRLKLLEPLSIPPQQEIYFYLDKKCSDE